MDEKTARRVARLHATASDCAPFPGGFSAQIWRSHFEYDRKRHLPYRSRRSDYTAKFEIENIVAFLVGRSRLDAPQIPRSRLSDA